ncbi:MAG: hypothetical protein K0V04_34780 [Deltaproteobacteria bacterium]|nr:hypothetical protein [Deltaproteobacteria bacterium]
MSAAASIPPGTLAEYFDSLHHDAVPAALVYRVHSSMSHGLDASRNVSGRIMEVVR